MQGSLAFVQGIYRDFYTATLMKYLSSPAVIPGDGSISSLLINVTHALDKNIHLISNLMSIEQFSPKLSLFLLNNMLDNLGLRPLEALWTQGPPNASSVLTIALEVGRNTQKVFTGLPVYNSQAELEDLLMQFLSMNMNHPSPLSVLLVAGLLSFSITLT